MRILGIDPGLTGGLALLDGDLIEVVDMPVLNGRVDGHQVATIISGWGRVDRVALEQVSTRPGQGGPATLKTGANWGVLVGVLAALERPTVEVLPSVWVAALGLPKSGRTPVEKRLAKEARRLRCKQLWPADAHLFARSKDDGRSDACLLALWCVREMRTAGAA